MHNRGQSLRALLAIHYLARVVPFHPAARQANSQIRVGGLQGSAASRARNNANHSFDQLLSVVFTKEQMQRDDTSLHH